MINVLIVPVIYLFEESFKVIIVSGRDFLFNDFLLSGKLKFLLNEFCE